MKMWELASGVRIPLSGEEQDLVEKLLENDDLVLSERQKVVAQYLANKDILTKEDRADGDNDYRINYHVDVWRD